MISAIVQALSPYIQVAAGTATLFPTRHTRLGAGRQGSARVLKLVIDNRANGRAARSDKAAPDGCHTQDSVTGAGTG